MADKQKNQRINRENTLWNQGFFIFLRLSSWIIGPLILGIIIGKWVDAKYENEPWGLFLSIIVAFIITMVKLFQETIKELKK